MNVRPRQALEAERKYPDKPYPWAFTILDSDELLASDAEFAAAFVPAERLDALIEAAWKYCTNRGEPLWGHDEALCPCYSCRLAAALRAYDEGQEQ